jgi:hypothetical protein
MSVIFPHVTNLYDSFIFPVSLNDNAPNTANVEYFDMMYRWDLINDLDGGTFTMRRRGTKWLPKNIEESDEAYQKRLAAAVLTPIYNRSIDNIASKPFSTGFNYTDMPPILTEDYFLDIDLQGNSLEQFAYNVFREAWNKGKSHILPSFPYIDSDDPILRNVAFQKNNKIRPYLKRIPPENLFAWQYTHMYGRDILTGIRYFTTEQMNLEFKTETVIIINELRLTDSGVIYNQYRNVRDTDLQGNVTDSWLLTQSTPLLNGAGRQFGFIPLVTYYTNKIEEQVAYPLLDDVAYLNQQHYVASSDQNTIVTWARLPILFGTNLEPEPGIPMTPEEEELWREKRKIKAAVNTIISAPEGADLKFVEHSGASINAGRTYIQDIENTARLTGLEVLVSDRRSGNVSATEQSIQAAQQTTTIMRAVSAFEDALELALEYMMEFEAVPKSVGSVNINKDFSISVTEQNVVTELLSARDAGIIDNETVLFELKRRRLLSDEVLELPDGNTVNQQQINEDAE